MAALSEGPLPAQHQQAVAIDHEVLVRPGFESFPARKPRLQEAAHAGVPDEDVVLRPSFEAEVSHSAARSCVAVTPSMSRLTHVSQVRRTISMFSATSPADHPPPGTLVAQVPAQAGYRRLFA